jgi:DnaJ-domain-containing protein 1
VRRESLADLAQRREGSLDETPFGAVLLAQYLERRSVALELRCRNVHKTLLLERGVPVECRTNLVRETFGEFLVSEGRISAFQWKESLAEGAERGVRIGEVLIERSFLDPIDLPGALQRNLGRRLLECFTWQKGDYRLVSELPETTPSSRINVARLAFTGLSRYTALEQMLAWVGPLPNRPLFLHHQPPVELHELRLPPTLRNLVTTLRREQPAKSLLKRNTLSRDELIRSLAALAVMEVIVVRRAAEDVEALDDEIRIELEEENSPEQEECAYKGSDRELSPEEAFRLRNEITVEHMTLARKGAYEVLGVTADTPKDEVRRRYVELVEHYAPARYETSELHSVAQMADDLLRATVTAYSEIADPQRGKPGGGADRCRRRATLRASDPRRRGIRAEREIQVRRRSATHGTRRLRERTGAPGAHRWTRCPLSLRFDRLLTRRSRHRARRIPARLLALGRTSRSGGTRAANPARVAWPWLRENRCAGLQIGSATPRQC